MKGAGGKERNSYERVRKGGAGLGKKRGVIRSLEGGGHDLYSFNGKEHPRREVDYRGIYKILVKKGGKGPHRKNSFPRRSYPRWGGEANRREERGSYR